MTAWRTPGCPVCGKPIGLRHVYFPPRQFNCEQCGALIETISPSAQGNWLLLVFLVFVLLGVVSKVHGYASWVGWVIYFTCLAVFVLVQVRTTRVRAATTDANPPRT